MHLKLLAIWAFAFLIAGFCATMAFSQPKPGTAPISGFCSMKDWVQLRDAVEAEGLPGWHQVIGTKEIQCFTTAAPYFHFQGQMWVTPIQVLEEVTDPEGTVVIFTEFEDLYGERGVVWSREYLPMPYELPGDEG